MTFNATDLLIDFAIMSILLFIAQYIRVKVKVIQRLFLPSSLLAGFIALFLGPQFLNILPFTSNMDSYAYLLVVFLFASLFIGNEGSGSFKETMSKVGDTFLISSGSYFIQYAVAILVGGIILMVFFPEIPEAFSILMPGGFIGGHGTAAAFGGAFKELVNWDEALSIGQTFATIGILVGVIVGIIAINIAVRKKETRFIKSVKELPESMKTGMVPKEEQESMGKNTVNPIALDPLTWHVALVLTATGGGYYISNYIQSLFPKLSIPMFAVAMMCGFLLQMILKGIKMDKYISKDVITRIGSSATDYLVAFGVASIKISVVIKYIYPILIFSLIGVITVVAYLLLVSKKFFKDSWFERGIFLFGWSTGVLAIGIILLRIVDPEFKSRTLEDYGIAYVFISPITIGIVSIMPMLVSKGFAIAAGLACLGIFMLILNICRRKYGVKKDVMEEVILYEPVIAEILIEDEI